MSERPELSKQLSCDAFLDHYYLKEELLDFCRKNGLPASGSKQELTQRIACYLETGKVSKAKTVKKAAVHTGRVLTVDSIIEQDIVCSQHHREFFKEHIGKSFSFNVQFQKWLKNNAGKTYSDAIDAYRRIAREKKKNKTVIDKQFEYNTYIRDFFSDNKDLALEDAIKCWKYKKSIKGHNRYEKSDLCALGEKEKEDNNAD
ncbi:MAG: SAP domain-containing protein [Ruminococcus sp.]|nr:SAP domain-containing protein [Ruminococcus sp.]